MTKIPRIGICVNWFRLVLGFALVMLLYISPTHLMSDVAPAPLFCFSVLIVLYPSQV